MLSPWKALVSSSCWEVPRLWFPEKEEAVPTLGSYLGSGPAVAVFQRGHLGGFVLGFLISEQGEEEHVPCSWDESWSKARTSASGLAPGISSPPPCCLLLLCGHKVDGPWGAGLRGGDVDAAGPL